MDFFELHELEKSLEEVSVQRTGVFDVSYNVNNVTKKDLETYFWKPFFKIVIRQATKGKLVTVITEDLNQAINMFADIHHMSKKNFERYNDMPRSFVHKKSGGRYTVYPWHLISPQSIVKNRFVWTVNVQQDISEILRPYKEAEDSAVVCLSIFGINAY